MAGKRTEWDPHPLSPPYGFLGKKPACPLDRHEYVFSPVSRKPIVLESIKNGGRLCSSIG